MELDQLKYNWELLGEEDPMWAILSVPSMKGGKWDTAEFFATGVSDVDGLLADASRLRIEIEFGQALDFGCGVGRMTQALSSHFRSVVGVDISSSMIRRANALNQFPAICRYHLNTKPNLEDFGDQQFDFCVSFLVLQHMKPEHARSYLVELCRVLKHKGVLLFQIPVFNRVAAEHASATQSPYALPAADADPVIEMHATPLHEVARTLHDHGLTIIAARSDGRAGPEFLSHEIWAAKLG